MDDAGQLPNTQNDKTEEDSTRPQYTMSGILHYIQHEWTKNELDRTRWEAERAEMQARIAFLQGERKGQESLKQDLVRRIKMLEFCLKQERAKNYRLTHNGDEPPSFEESANENSAPSDNSHLSADLDAYINDAGEAGGTFRQGRLLLKRYLEEIGYSEHIMDVRSFRVKNLLGLLPQNFQTDLPSSERLNGKKERSDSDSDDGHDDGQLDADASKAFEEFDFLNNMDTREKSSDLDEWAGKGASFEKLIKQYKDDPKVKRRSRNSTEDLEEKTSEVHKNLETDVPPGIRAAIEATAHEDLPVKRPGRRSGNFAYGNGNELNAALGMQANENMDIKDEFAEEQDDEADKKVKWNIKVTLRSHFDQIYAMQFHPVEPVLFTASEDGLVKLWNLEQKRDDKHNSGGGSELEPVYTFRGHKGAVLCLVLSTSGDHLYTGGVDGNICCFNVPSSNSDPFDTYNPRVLAETLTGHTDAIWSVAYHSANSRLVSASSDSTIRLWEPGNGEPLIRTIGAPRPGLLPTSVDFVSTETSHLLAAYTECYAQIIDIDTGSTVMVFDFKSVTGSPTMNKIVSHPTMPMTVVAGEDRVIRYFDNTTGSLIGESVAHVEGVSSLAIDPNGLYLLSGSHDGSIRLWNIEKRTCLQEISAHRKKNDAAVTSVAFHPSQSLIGSAGADSLAKIYVAGGAQ